MEANEVVSRRALLCSLPTEVKQAILCHLPELHALKAAILSHSSLYSAFLDRKESIALQVLLNFLPHELLPDAMLALDASSIEGWTWSNRAMTQNWTREKVLSILDRHRHRGCQISKSMSLNDLHSMQQLYQVIEAFTSDFITAALSKNPALPQCPPSSREWNRVARSFYRLEVYRHLFRNRDDYDYRDEFERPKASLDFERAEQWDVYYRHYAVWELEQLATVAEYLFRRIAIPFNEIAAHDVDWGSSGVNYNINEAWEFNQRYGYIPGLISNGLGFILKATTAPTYEQRKNLFSRNLRGVYPFLPGLLQWIFHGGVRGTTPLKEYTHEQAKELQIPEVEEPDSGPAEAWKWSHMDLNWNDFVWSLHCRELRAWGYVMWDNARLSDYIYSQPFTSPPPPDEDELEQRKEATVASMVKRNHLFRKGAKGWWAEGDESHLEWGKPPQFSDDEEDWEEQFIELVSDL